MPTFITNSLLIGFTLHPAQVFVLVVKLLLFVFFSIQHNLHRFTSEVNGICSTRVLCVLRLFGRLSRYVLFINEINACRLAQLISEWRRYAFQSWRSGLTSAVRVKCYSVYAKGRSFVPKTNWSFLAFFLAFLYCNNVMQRSQIKLPSCDFNDVQNTCEYRIRPSTGRIPSFLSYTAIYSVNSMSWI